MNLLETLSPVINFFVAPAYAQQRGMGEAASAGGHFEVQELSQLIANIVNAFLLLIGVVLVIYLIIGGYQYATAGGNAEQAQAARTTILNAVIGIVIVVGAWAISSWVISRITGQTF